MSGLAQCPYRPGSGSGHAAPAGVKTLSWLFKLTPITPLFALAALISPTARAITITPTGDANLLASTILAPGVTMVGTPTLTGGNVDSLLSSAGIFTDGLTTGIGINAGIVLTSGQAGLIGNSNTSDDITGDFSGPGDAALNALIPGYETFDATVLEFQFRTNNGNLFFNFSFGSDEYNEWTNSPFNDVFGFYVDGVNIALLPGTTIPISINNVNGGNPLGSNVSNSQYFRNNDLTDGGPFFNFEYDGFTKVFTVSALGLNPNPHTIRLAVADAGDHVLDTGVFIQAQSFGSTVPPKDDDPFDDHGNHVPDAGGTFALLAVALSGLIALSRPRR